MLKYAVWPQPCSTRPGTCQCCQAYCQVCVFAVAAKTACQVTTIDQDTAEEGEEPLTMLGSFR